MALDNLISIEFTQAELDEIDLHLQGIESVITAKMVNLTPEQRSQYGSINNEMENWIVKSFAYMQQRPDLVPAYISVPEFTKDQNTRNAIKPRLNVVNGIREMFEDTSMLISWDIFQTAIAFYRNVKIASMQNVPGTTNIYQDLQQQFPGRPKKKTPPTP